MCPPAPPLCAPTLQHGTSHLSCLYIREAKLSVLQWSALADIVYQATLTKLTAEGRLAGPDYGSIVLCSRSLTALLYYAVTGPIMPHFSSTLLCSRCSYRPMQLCILQLYSIMQTLVPLFHITDRLYNTIACIRYCGDTVLCSRWSHYAYFSCIAAV